MARDLQLVSFKSRPSNTKVLTFASGTSWYDEALSEMVLEEVNFAWKKDWYCVMGGSQEIAKRIAAKVENEGAKRIHFGKKVTKIETRYYL